MRGKLARLEASARALIDHGEMGEKGWVGGMSGYGEGREESRMSMLDLYGWFQPMAVIFFPVKREPAFHLLNP